MLAWLDTAEEPTPARTTILRHRVHARRLPASRVALLRELYGLIDYLAEHPDIPVDKVEVRASASRLCDDAAGRAVVETIAAGLDAPLTDRGHVSTDRRLSEHVKYHAWYIPLALRDWETAGAAND